MKKNYELQGMSCGGCVSSVKKVLLQLPGVEDAEVHLHPQSAVITMSEAIGVEEVRRDRPPFHRPVLPRPLR